MTRDEADSVSQIACDVLDRLHESCIVIDFEWRYVYANDAAVQQGRVARDQLLGRTMQEVYPGVEDRAVFASLRRCMVERRPDRVAAEYDHADGTAFFDVRIFPVPQGLCILSLDVSARKRAEEEARRSEEQLRESQKMEAIGNLAGGVAHDFNNLLSVVLGYSDLLLARLGEGDPMRGELEEIAAAGRRATELTRQLLAFGRRQLLEPAPTNINDVIAGTEKMLRRLLGEDIELVVRPAPYLGAACLDAGKIEQVVMNLVVNARDAMPRGGTLTIETANVDIEAAAKEQGGVAPGSYVMLTISDDGVGMDEATRVRIFEPFFTTKAGKGTGLGLSTVFGIVQQSDGHIRVTSEPGRGTTFEIYFPRIADAAVAREGKAGPHPSPIGDLGGTETILLVEDEASVRAVALSILRRRGYQVLEAGSGAEALLVCERHAATIDLMVTDVVMPKMSGRELATRMREVRPNMKVLYMSGYTENTIDHHGVLDSGIAFLQKPITPENLAQKVREVLDG